MRLLLVSLLSIACGDGVPDPCVDMCVAAVPLAAECLEADGLDWSATQWGSPAGFLASCETWAWEQLQLERDARARRAVRGQGHTEAACEARLESFVGRGATCDTYEAIDWDAPVWESP